MSLKRLAEKVTAQLLNLSVTHKAPLTHASISTSSARKTHLMHFDWHRGHWVLRSWQTGVDAGRCVYSCFSGYGNYAKTLRPSVFFFFFFFFSFVFPAPSSAFFFALFPTSHMIAQDVSKFWITLSLSYSVHAGELYRSLVLPGDTTLCAWDLQIVTGDLIPCLSTSYTLTWSLPDSTTQLMASYDRFTHLGRSTLVPPP